MHVCGRSQCSVVQQVTWLASCSVVQGSFSLQANLMLPSIPTDTCWTGWLTALSGKVLRQLMQLIPTCWDCFFNVAPVCLTDLSFQVFSFCLSAYIYFYQLSFWLFAQLAVWLVCVFTELVPLSCSVSVCTCVSFPYSFSSVSSTCMSVIPLPVDHPPHVTVLFVFLFLRHSF